MGASLIGDVDIAKILKNVYLQHRRAVFSTAFPLLYRYRANHPRCWECNVDVPEDDREPHEMWHRLMEAP